MIVLAIGIMCLAGIYRADAQGAALTTVRCDNSPCSRGSFGMSFKLSGNPSVGASDFVIFYRNGDGSRSPCTIPRSVPCNTSTLCGCTESGGEKTFHFNITSASSSIHDGNWTAVVEAFSPADEIHSPVCSVRVNDSCQFLVRDVCPTAPISTGENLHISFTRTRQFPSTSGTSLNFIVGGTMTNVQGTVNLNACPYMSLPAGCFERDGKMVYYINITARPDRSGDWKAVVPDSNGNDAIESDLCNVRTPDPLSRPVSIGLLIALAILSVLYFAVVIYVTVGGQTNEKVAVIVAFVGAAIVLIFVIAVGAYSLGTFMAVTRAFPDLYDASIAFVVIGCITVIVGLALGIVKLSKR